MNIKSMFTDTLYIRMFFIQLLSLVSIMAQQPSRTLSAVDAELACICGENSSPYAERIRLIHSLPSNLAPGQLERCRAFLESPLAGQPLPDLEFNALKNELVFALLRQRDGFHAKVVETSPVGQKTVADLAQGVLAGDLRVEGRSGTAARR